MSCSAKMGSSSPSRYSDSFRITSLQVKVLSSLEVLSQPLAQLQTRGRYMLTVYSVENPSTSRKRKTSAFSFSRGAGMSGTPVLHRPEGLNPLAYIRRI